MTILGGGSRPEKFENPWPTARRFPVVVPDMAGPRDATAASRDQRTSGWPSGLARTTHCCPLNGKSIGLWGTAAIMLQAGDSTGGN